MLKDAQELSKKLKGQVDAEKATSLADRIQKHSSHDLAALCDFNTPQRIRRLTNVPPQAWGLLEQRWATSDLLRIAQLMDVKGERATLALACYGIERDGLSKALQALDGGKPADKPASKKAAPLPSPEGDDEIDPATQEALDSLRSEVGKLAK